MHHQFAQPVFGHLLKATIHKQIGADRILDLSQHIRQILIR